MTSTIDILFIFADGGGRRVKKLVIFVDVINEWPLTCSVWYFQKAEPVAQSRSTNKLF